MDWRLACRCAYEESSLALVTGACSNGLGFRSVGIVSVEKDFGSKPRGDAVRMKPLVGRDGKGWLVCSSLGPPTETLDGESGDGEASRLGTSFIDGGDALSGFAIRRPPSDCVRLKSPSI